MKFPLEKQEELRNKSNEIILIIVVDYAKLFEEIICDVEGNIKREKPSEETIKLKVFNRVKSEISSTQRRLAKDKYWDSYNLCH